MSESFSFLNIFTLEPVAIFFALVGGILPALFWLWFWLKEDRAHPEPRSLIILSFLAGMAAVIAVIPAQKLINDYVSNVFWIVLLFATVEELAKFFLAKISVLHRKDVDEPTDPLIYLITVALGFSALENALFLLSPILDGQVVSGIITGNLRFVGATLLHIASSATIGTAIAFGFYRNRLHKIFYLIFGVILSVALHTLFNLLIMEGDGKNIFLVFAGVWVMIILLILMFERVKKVHP
jgi:RsiW-degrading membrane proteinase PrsW (M82 family)